MLRDDRVLLVQRGNEPWKGYWSIPGGVVHTGELLKDAVIREMREETGLAVEPIEVVEVFESISVLFHYVVIDYLCRAVDGELKAGDDALDARWFPVSALPEHITAGAPEVIQRAILKARAQFISTRV